MNNPILFGRKELSGTFVSESAVQQAPMVVCGWCGTEISPGVGPPSHGICRSCLETQRQKLRQMRARGLAPLMAME